MQRTPTPSKKFLRADFVRVYTILKLVYLQVCSGLIAKVSDLNLAYTPPLDLIFSSRVAYLLSLVSSNLMIDSLFVLIAGADYGLKKKKKRKKVKPWFVSASINLDYISYLKTISASKKNAPLWNCILSPRSFQDIFCSLSDNKIAPFAVHCVLCFW